MIRKCALVAPLGASLIAVAWIALESIPAVGDDSVRDGIADGNGTGGGAGKDVDNKAHETLRDPKDDDGTGGGAGQTIDKSGTGGGSGDADDGGGTGGGAGAR